MSIQQQIQVNYMLQLLLAYKLGILLVEQIVMDGI